MHTWDQPIDWHKLECILDRTYIGSLPAGIRDRDDFLDKATDLFWQRDVYGDPAPHTQLAIQARISHADIRAAILANTHPDDNSWRLDTHGLTQTLESLWYTADQWTATNQWDQELDTLPAIIDHDSKQDAIDLAIDHVRHLPLTGQATRETPSFNLPAALDGAITRDAGKACWRLDRHRLARDYMWGVAIPAGRGSPDPALAATPFDALDTLLGDAASLHLGRTYRANWLNTQGIIRPVDYYGQTAGPGEAELPRWATIGWTIDQEALDAAETIDRLDRRCVAIEDGEILRLEDGTRITAYQYAIAIWRSL